MSTPREVADRYVDALCELDPLVATQLGTRPGDDRLPDLSPAGLAAEEALERETLAELDTVLAADPSLDEDPIERRCARLLRERIGGELAMHEAGEGFLTLNNLFSPVHAIRQIFSLMPAASEDDWAVIARRMARVPEAYRQFTETLEEGCRRGLVVAPRQAETVVVQLDEWLAGPYFAGFVATGPEPLLPELVAAARAADEAVAEIRDYLRDVYLPHTDGTPDAVGRERYALAVRRWTGSDLGAGQGLEDAYAWGWSEYRRILAEQRHRGREGAARARPRWRPCAGWATNGPSVEGVEAVRERLQAMMDDAIAALDGTHFDLAEPVRRVEAMIAPARQRRGAVLHPPGAGLLAARAAPGCRPSVAPASRCGTWSRSGTTRASRAITCSWRSGPTSPRQLSTYQTSLGSVGANVEGWALYAERLMDELGYLTDPGERLGFLDAQQLRSVRVVIDIGMHLGLPVPDDAEGALAEHRGQPWTPELARAFLGENSGADIAFLDSELVRYLGIPGQAISYKLGERAWLAGRAAAQENRGAGFDLKAWHMAALSQGSLGLDDLAAELAQL